MTWSVQSAKSLPVSAIGSQISTSGIPSASVTVAATCSPTGVAWQSYRVRLEIHEHTTWPSQPKRPAPPSDWPDDGPLWSASQ
ncbi:hypothetical protein GCM10010507_10090 [Streptomyces cinnamoneus]|uniref:Uncharacterized protein n=1 Tax=Streptomyces cinnamoneus TaxID=53446 RepID=A0A918TCH1_STRCJ|nr:hypothetical protein GCM10010507_10090 [Streptomyces cinnamoneus]